MCIALIATAHPAYALIILDNRDEFVQRPTSLPHWWTSPQNGQKVLSSRDLHRAEQGTWLGITKAGNFGVLTNYREESLLDDGTHAVQGLKSRGGMVTAWLDAPEDEDSGSFANRLLETGGVKGVGGFSLVAGKLRRRGEHELDPMAVISNRNKELGDVPWIAGERGLVYGLSNASYQDPEIWPKVKMGKEKMAEVITEATKETWSEEKLVEAFLKLLDIDTLPPPEDGEEFERYVLQLRKSIFIPPITSNKSERLPKADKIASADPAIAKSKDDAILIGETKPAAENNFMSGVYGTQRQTVILVDWDGKVTYIERALFDEDGNSIERGHGDQRFEYQIDGWNDKR